MPLLLLLSRSLCVSSLSPLLSLLLALFLYGTSVFRNCYKKGFCLNSVKKKNNRERERERENQNNEFFCGCICLLFSLPSSGEYTFSLRSHSRCYKRSWRNKNIATSISKCLRLRSDVLYIYIYIRQQGSSLSLF